MRSIFSNNTRTSSNFTLRASQEPAQSARVVSSNYLELPNKPHCYWIKYTY